MAKNARTDVMASASDLEKVLNTSIVKLADALKIQGPTFFPNGIELITIRAKVVSIEVELTVAGPKAKSGMVDSAVAPSGTPASTVRPSVQ
jgi:hypothetical protein